jgi:uncharacterized protein (TIGR03546 family)
LLKPIAKLILALNGNVKASQIAMGFSWGVFLGLVPMCAFWIALFLISFFFRHNHGAKIFCMAIIKLISPLVVYPLDALGFFILTHSALQELFTTLYNMPFVPFTKFNNTLVMGGLVSGLVLWIPVFVLFMVLIPLYRNTVAPKIRDSKIVKKIAKFPLFSLIDKAISKNQ